MFTHITLVISLLSLGLVSCGGEQEGAEQSKASPAARSTKSPVKKSDKPATGSDAKSETKGPPAAKPGPKGDPGGLAIVTSTRSFDATVKGLKGAIKSAGLAIVFEANHQNMIKMVGMESKASVTIGFAKAEMGKMLMSKEPRLALEMPMRMAVRELDDGAVAVLYYRPSYMFSAFGKPQLVEMAKKKPGPLLAKLAAAASGATVVPSAGPKAPDGALVSVVSANSHGDTVAKIKAAVKEKGLALVYEANHQNMMKMVGIESKPSVVIGVAKPEMAAQLMQVDPKVALEMPMRIAVRTLDDDSVVVLYYAPSFLLSHYQAPKLQMMAQKKLDPMLAMLAKAGTK